MENLPSGVRVENLTYPRRFREWQACMRAENSYHEVALGEISRPEGNGRYSVAWSSYVAIQLSDGWNAELDRGPDWLFVRLSGGAAPGGPADLSGAIWKLLEQSMAHRLVLELDALPILPSQVIGELVRLHKRIHAHGGVMRLSGLSDHCQEVLRINRLDDRFPHYSSRHDAVMGFRPVQPR